MGKKWGDEKNAHFFKNQKNGELKKKKKWGENGGAKKTAHFQKMGTPKKKKWANDGQLESIFFRMWALTGVTELTKGLKFCR